MHFDRLESRTLLTSVLTQPWAYVQSGELRILVGYFGGDAVVRVEKGVAKLTVTYGLDRDQVYRQTVRSKAGTVFHRVKIDLSDAANSAVVSSDLPTVIHGYKGDDSITLSAARSTVYGDEGNDTLISSPPLLSNQPEQATTKNVGRGTVPGETIEMIEPSYNVLEGNAGDDILQTRGGNDALHGGAGRDTLVKLNHDIQVERHVPDSIGYVPEARIVLKSRVGIFSVEAIGAPVESNSVRVLWNGGLDNGSPVSIYPVAPKKR